MFSLLQLAKALLTFNHQVVYNPIIGRNQHLTPLSLKAYSPDLITFLFHSNSNFSISIHSPNRLEKTTNLFEYNPELDDYSFLGSINNTSQSLQSQDEVENIPPIDEILQGTTAQCSHSSSRVQPSESSVVPLKFMTCLPTYYQTSPLIISEKLEHYSPRDFVEHKGSPSRRRKIMKRTKGLYINSEEVKSQIIDNDLLPFKNTREIINQKPAFDFIPGVSCAIETLHRRKKRMLSTRHISDEGYQTQDRHQSVMETSTTYTTPDPSSDLAVSFELPTPSTGISLDRICKKPLWSSNRSALKSSSRLDCFSYTIAKLLGGSMRANSMPTVKYSNGYSDERKQISLSEHSDQQSPEIDIPFPKKRCADLGSIELSQRFSTRTKNFIQNVEPKYLKSIECESVYEFKLPWRVKEVDGKVSLNNQVKYDNLETRNISFKRDGKYWDEKLKFKP